MAKIRANLKEFTLIRKAGPKFDEYCIGQNKNNVQLFEEINRVIENLGPNFFEKLVITEQDKYSKLPPPDYTRTKDSPRNSPFNRNIFLMLIPLIFIVIIYLRKMKKI